MEQRVSIEKTLPEVYKALGSLALVINKTDLNPIHKELIKLRASQINSCAFCLNMHSVDALKLGETQQRLFLLSAWRETDLFTPEEKALLALTEEVTLISAHGVSDAVYAEASKYFDEKTIAQIIVSIVMINAWNRVAVSTHMPLPKA